MAWHRIGIIGYGGFGKFLHHSWNQLSDVEIVAMADENPSCDPDGNYKFFRRWSDLLRDADVDIVSIATPPSSHAGIACAAMECGVNVLIEKPLATSVKDAERIIAVREKTGKKATVNYMMRFNPLIESLALLGASGVFGELFRVDVENYAQDGELPPDHWFWNPDIGGGILIEHAVHFFDLVDSLTDQRPERITGICHSRSGERENEVLADILYDNGLIATHYHSFSRPGFFEETSIRLVYDLAQIELKGWIPLSGRIRVLVNSQTGKRLEALPGLAVEENVSIDQIEDVSRPEGWGTDRRRTADMRKNSVRSGGKTYPVDRMITASFSAGRSKAELYSEGVRAVLQDLVKAVEKPGHRLRVTLEDGLSSLRAAAQATRNGRSPSQPH